MASTFSVTRTATVHATAERVSAAIADLHEWEKWSPWHDIDPQQTLTYGGPAAGVGATSAWKGNRKVGEGSMEVLRVEPTLIEVAVHFIKPFRANNLSRFALTPQGRDTAVTWTMTGTNNLFMRIFGVFMNMDRRIGNDFEKGLARLNAVLSDSAS